MTPRRRARWSSPLRSVLAVLPAAPALAGGGRRLEWLRRRRWRRPRRRPLHPLPDPHPAGHLRPRDRCADHHRAHRALPDVHRMAPARARRLYGRRRRGPRRPAPSPSASAASSWPPPRPPRTTRPSRPTPSGPRRRAVQADPGGVERRGPLTLQRLVGPRLLSEWERRLDDFRAKGWHNRVQVARRADGPVRGPDPAATAPATRSSCGSRPGCATSSRTGRATASKRPGHLARRSRCASSGPCARTRRRLADPRLHRAGRRGQHALNEQLVATAWSDEQALRDESLVEGAVADAVPAGIDIAEVADLELRRRRPRGCDRPQRGRRPLCAGRAGGQRPARGRRLGAGRRRRRCPLRALADPACRARAAPPGRSERRNPARRPGAEDPADPDRGLGRRRRSADDDRRGRRSRAGATSRTARHGGRRRGDQVAVARLHRALDLRADRRRAQPWRIGAAGRPPAPRLRPPVAARPARP